MIGSLCAALSWLVSLCSLFVAIHEDLIFPFNYYFYGSALFFAIVGCLLWEVSSCSVYLKKIYRMQYGEVKIQNNEITESHCSSETNKKNLNLYKKDKLIGQDIENNIRNITSIASQKIKNFIQKDVNNN